MKSLIAMMNIVRKIHLWLHFVNMDFKMPLIYLYENCKNMVGGTDSPFKAEVYVGGINFVVT